VAVGSVAVGSVSVGSVAVGPVAGGRAVPVAGATGDPGRAGDAVGAPQASATMTTTVIMAHRVLFPINNSSSFFC
jgi:hypothetical protein